MVRSMVEKGKGDGLRKRGRHNLESERERDWRDLESDVRLKEIRTKEIRIKINQELGYKYTTKF